MLCIADPFAVTWRTDAPARVPRVRERDAGYEDEGSERVARGGVTVGGGGWWTATLTTSATSPLAEGRDTVLLRLERRGTASASGTTNAHVEIVLPASELDAVLAVLHGVVVQARRDGVIGAP